MSEVRKKKMGKRRRYGRRSSKQTKKSAIIREDAVVSRLAVRSVVSTVTSNGTISAAVMVGAALLAVVVANSPLFEPVHHFLSMPLGLDIGSVHMGISLEGFVNDFLMSIFFLLVGIELKYEMTVGQLRKPRQAALPMLAAVGGVAVPALIFLFFNHAGAANGWAIPIATDIAFALGVMSLLGDRVAPETKVFFQTLAIADDILAIVVLAVFYGQSPNVAWCALSLLVILVLAGIHRARVYTAKYYVLIGLVLWFCMYNSGIHATLAGVILAFFLPAKSDVRLSNLRDWLNSKARDLEDDYDDTAHVLGQHDFTEAANQVERVMHHVTPPLQRVERYIATMVNFFILPVFAFVNAQVRLVGADLGMIVHDPVTQGAYLGAVVGKPIGIILVTLLLVKIGFAKLPRHVTWDQIIAVGIMGGMGFTMSILIAGLAFPNPAEVMAAKCAILAGSFTAALLGILFVRVHDLIKVGATPKGRAQKEASGEGAAAKQTELPARKEVDLSPNDDFFDE
ncbi:Na+/H+ antiporter NhaA [Olsenella sp. KH1P3]|uniref:Na(+)/H(+) antiporter NhaA n=2 Tax=Parafannyhessea umbonata TaxID=604330 RepID=A0A1H9MZ22_9ACTN|nr:sodium/proton antiporter, NhaA family [Parafannyhessea umbonata]SER28954.1 sodium/proton antiporter, NhaA family [Parafannyhessea umbonata]SJZ37940.1 sodium/proton antiporter, NhaA family (TC 2.A.33.1.1) [Olsenella sp. KH1P3]